jgi:diguanylate cyclase
MSATSRASNRVRPLPPNVSVVFVATGIALAMIHSFRLLGENSDIAMNILALGGLGAVAYGTIRNRPSPTGPWWLVVASGTLFVVGTIVREGVGSTGDLSSHRSLLPDFFSFPGYLCFVISLVWLLKIRGREQRDLGVATDATIIALASLIIAWTLLIDPTLDGRRAATRAIVAVSIYPPVSVFLVSIAARLAFSPGSRSMTHRFLMVSMSGLLAGDVVYFLTDVHAISPPGRIVDLPYGLAYALVGGAALHPSVREVARPMPARDGFDLRRSRIPLVAVALLVPALVIVAWHPKSAFDRALVGTAVCALVCVGIARIVVAMRDQSRSERRYAYQAMHDQLTGLPNRAHLLEFISSAIESAGPRSSIAVVFLDIDRFRLVNDSLGHATGDRLLRAVAARLQTVTRPGDLVSRISGDEFVVVATGTDAIGAAVLGERLRAAFERPLDIGTDIHVTVSIGVAHLDGSARPDAAADLVRDADTATYRSKDKDGNAVTLFDESMREMVARRLRLESTLRRAIDTDELEVHYQPIVSLATGEVEGFEALARWRTPDGWVSPIEFIPIAEESGLIILLGQWIMNEACRQLACWRAQPGCGDLTMSVNVSPRQIRSSDVVAMVRSALDAVGLPGRALWFEITESTMMLDTEDTVATIESLHAQGVRVCVDDFGTGFSSLSYLQKFAIDRLKIDRSFVEAMGSGAASRSLVSAIVAITHTLHIDSVAEGVETSDQAAGLVSLGCRGAQGYLFGRPVPASEIDTLLLSRVGSS